MSNAQRSRRVTFRELKAETDDAILVVTRDEREVWIPFSQITTINRGDPPSIDISEWLANKEDL